MLLGALPSWGKEAATEIGEVPIRQDICGPPWVQCLGESARLQFRFKAVRIEGILSAIDGRAISKSSSLLVLCWLVVAANIGSQ